MENPNKQLPYHEMPLREQLTHVQGLLRTIVSNIRYKNDKPDTLESDVRELFEKIRNAIPDDQQ